MVTNPRIWKDAASTPVQATAQINAWLGSPILLVHYVEAPLAEDRDFQLLPKLRTRDPTG